MSQRSIIEINHDQSGRITSDPGGFLYLLTIALASGSDRSWAPLSQFGVTRITQCHHSEDRKVVIGHGQLQREYPFG
jgi:hypothetical protein